MASVFIGKRGSLFVFAEDFDGKTFVVERITQTPNPDKFLPRGGNILNLPEFVKEAGVTIPAITSSDSIFDGQNCPANFPATVAGYGRGREADMAVFYQFGYVAPPVAPAPTVAPAVAPSTVPSTAPTVAPAVAPSIMPSTSPSVVPTVTPITPSAPKGIFASATTTQKSLAVGFLLAVVAAVAWFFSKDKSKNTKK